MSAPNEHKTIRTRTLAALLPKLLSGELRVFADLHQSENKATGYE
jgi:hypothetical protein